MSFPSLGRRPIIDMLIGLDLSDLHYSLKEVKGNPGEPIARLTNLGQVLAYSRKIQKMKLITCHSSWGGKTTRRFD